MDPFKCNIGWSLVALYSHMHINIKQLAMGIGMTNLNGYVLDCYVTASFSQCEYYFFYGNAMTDKRKLHNFTLSDDFLGKTLTTLSNKDRLT